MGSKASKVLSKLEKKEERLEVPKNESPEGSDIKSLQYDIYMEEEALNTLPKSIYEKSAQLAGKLLPLDPDKKTREKMENAIEFAHLNVTPRGVMALTVFVGFILFVSLAAILVSGLINLTTGVVGFCIAAGLTYYFYTYPSRLKKIYELRVGSEIVMMVLHMVIYMRNYPNLEGAVKFSTANIQGPLALDLKKLSWDVHMGVYDSMEQGILAFSQKWKATFRSFSDSINAIIYSMYTSGKRRNELLDESVDIILDSLSERSTSYVTKLKSPVALVNALGILLPIMVLTMLPIMTIFLDDIPQSLIFGGYDLLLPMVLIFVIKNILDQRVVTLPEPDLSLNPDLPPKGMFLLGKISVYSLIPALLVFAPFLYYAVTSWSSLGIMSNASLMQQGLFNSYVIIFGLFATTATYFYVNSFQKIKFRKEILEMEDEFREVLFGLGQEIDRGIPIEVALNKIAPTLRGQYAINLIEKILDNIHYKGMTFERAIFDPQEGAIRYFPSKLIHSVLKAVTDASQKGTKIAAEVMISVSKYLSDIHRTQEMIMDRFSEILGSMKMQAQILLPLICAVMSILTYMIIRMMDFLNDQISNLSTTGQLSSYTSLLSMFREVNIAPAMFQIAVGIYAIETIIILTWFMNGIIHGVDQISLHNEAWRNLLVGGFLYLLISLIAVTVFTPFFDVLTISGSV